MMRAAQSSPKACLQRHFGQLVVAVIFFMSGSLLMPKIAYANELDGMQSRVTVSYDHSDSDFSITPLAWYGSTLNMLTSYTFPQKSFDGNSIGIEMNAHCQVDGTFTVTLYQIIGDASYRIGSATFKRNGFTKATWENVGSGTYQFVCHKSADKAYVISSDVAMYSW